MRTAGTGAVMLCVLAVGSVYCQGSIDVTYASLGVQVQTHVDPQPKPDIGVYDDSDYDEFDTSVGDTFPGFLSAGASSTQQASDANGNNLAVIEQTGSVDLTDPSSGVADVMTTWYATTSKPGSSDDTGGGYAGDFIVTVQFDALADGYLVLDYYITGYGSTTFGFLQAHDVSFDGNWYDIDLPDENPVTVDDSLLLPIEQGETYFLEIFGYPNLGTSYMSNDDVLESTWEWSYRVPEPSTVALLGIAMTGILQRCRRWL